MLVKTFSAKKYFLILYVCISGFPRKKIHMAISESFSFNWFNQVIVPKNSYNESKSSVKISVKDVIDFDGYR